MNKGYYSDSSEFKGTGKRVVIILICVALLFGLMYSLTTRILSKEVTKKRKQNEVTEWLLRRVLDSHPLPIEKNI